MGQVKFTAQEMADAFRVGLSTVTRLAREGTFVRLARDQYDLIESCGRYCEQLREVAAGRGGKQSVETLSMERARLAKEQADNMAFKNAQLRKELLPVDEVLSAWTGFVMEIRAGMLSIPARFQMRVQSLTRAEVAMLDDEIRSALSILAHSMDDTTATADKSAT